MKGLRLAGALCLALSLTLVGCGGGGGGSSSGPGPTPTPGGEVWAGSYNPNNGVQGQLKLGFIDSGGQLNGTGRVTAGATRTYGAISGPRTAFVVRLNNEDVIFTPTTQNAFQMQGTFGSATTNGTFSITLQNEATFNVSGGWTGSFTPTGGTATNLAVTFAQNGNTVTGTATVGGAQNVQITNGQIVGDLIRFTVVVNDTLRYFATVDLAANPDVITGSYTSTGGQSGTVTLTKGATQNDNVAGAWEGVLENSNGGVGPFAVNINQNGAQLDVNATAGVIGPGAGLVNGSQVTFTINSAGGNVTFTGTFNAATNAIAGSYSGAASGDFTLLRQ